MQVSRGKTGPGRRASRVSGLSRWIAAAAMLSALMGGLPAWSQVDYSRPVDVAPTEENIGEGYLTPEVQRPRSTSKARQLLDLGLLAGALGLAAWLVLKTRSRRYVVILAIACLAYFGFVREGCICPIGSIQNVTTALVDPNYAIPYFVIGIFMLPLVAALFFGRVFCSGVCALGSIQELVLLKPIEVPPKLDRVLGSFRWVYLVAAIGFAVLPAINRDFIICRFDPFVGFFRFTGPFHMLLLGGLFLVVGVFVGRPYCRYLCPYGALLSVFSRYAWKSVSITPNRELDCGLCQKACPYGAIEEMRAVRTSCLACARCYDSCPIQRSQEPAILDAKEAA
jgi:NosR/NirI family nitrous oxide reductase transcriptional regulator